MELFKKKTDLIQTKKKEQCPNCSYLPLLPETKFCPSCGQECIDKRVTVWSLVAEAFANFFNLDNKLWQTLLNLFIPGKLTKEFFAERRQRYVSPLRFFLITALGFFAVIQLFTSDANDSLGAFSSQQKEDGFYAVFLEKLNLESDTLLQDSILFSSAKLALDSLGKRMHNSYEDSITIGVTNLFSKKDSLDGLTIARKDLVQIKEDSIIKQYGNGNYLDDILLKQNIRLARNSDNFLSYLMGQLVWMMLIMMPFLALFLKLLYIRRDFYYVDHLIFSFHSHAFVFVLLSVLSLVNNYMFDHELLMTINTIGVITVFAYLYIALLRVYGQSKRKTFIKFLMMNVAYVILFCIAIVLTSVFTALIY